MVVAPSLPQYAGEGERADAGAVVRLLDNRDLPDEHPDGVLDRHDVELLI